MYGELIISTAFWNSPCTRKATSSSPTVAATRALRNSRRTGCSSSRGTQKGTAAGQFASVDSIAVDAQGNVYAADAGNARIQVFDNNGTFKTEIKSVGNAQAICMTAGAKSGPVRVEFESADRSRYRR